MGSRYQKFYSDAVGAYMNGRYHEAALLYEQAQRLAQKHGTPAQVFECGVWAAISWVDSAHPLRALTLLTDLLKEIPPSAVPDYVWDARMQAFEISRCHNPQLSALRRKLAKLKNLAEDNTHLPQADVPLKSAHLLQAQGRYREALDQLELAWTYNYDNRGFANFYIAEGASLANLHLGHFDAARRWCEILGQTNIDIQASLVAWHVAQVHLALWEQNTVGAQAQACVAEEQTEGLQHPEYQQKAMAIRVRALLLQTNLGDPTAPRHPARYRLAQRIPGKPDVYMVYERRRLLVDYRLAAVRYVVGMQPVDDLWYTRPQTLPETMPTFDRDDFQKRVLQTRRAGLRAMAQAEYLDECFECSWRQSEIRGRVARLDEISRRFIA
jgi:tetratricopeptide (TPR) repeat protein